MNHKELIERLRDTNRHTFALWFEAADAIESLLAENERLKDERAKYRDASRQNADQFRDAKKWRNWVNAQTAVEEQMPEGYYITMNCEPQNWYLYLHDPEGNEIRIDSYESTDDFFLTAVEAAKEHAQKLIVKPGETK